MSFEFNVNEVFEMAKQIERNGAEFYRKAAESVSGENKEILLKLAAFEDQHEKDFAMVQSNLSDKEKESSFFDPDEETKDYLKALADMRVFFEKGIDVSSMENILKDAIVAEKDSILFYEVMKNIIPENLGKNKVDDIIKEEMRHIVILKSKLEEIKK